MNKKELGEEVLAHWTRLSACNTIEEVRKEDYGISNCAFCIEFYSEGRDPSGAWGCEGCPIREDTKLPNCEATPYEAFFNAVEDWQGGDKFPQAEIDAELTYLKGIIERMEES
jgi:hypothetical protein